MLQSKRPLHVEKLLCNALGSRTVLDRLAHFLFHFHLHLHTHDSTLRLHSKIKVYHELACLFRYPFTEKYAPSTFFRNYVQGIVSTLNVKVSRTFSVYQPCQLISQTLLTNWNLQARFYDIISSGGENLAESAVRQANAQAYTEVETR